MRKVKCNLSNHNFEIGSFVELVAEGEEMYEKPDKFGALYKSIGVFKPEFRNCWWLTEEELI